MTDYPLPKFHFQVDWGGTRIGFTEVTGLGTETEVIEYRDGANPGYSKQKIPGMQKFGNITLKRGVFASDNEYFAWWNTVSLNTIERRDVTVSLIAAQVRRHHRVMPRQFRRHLMPAHMGQRIAVQQQQRWPLAADRGIDLGPGGCEAFIPESRHQGSGAGIARRICGHVVAVLRFCRLLTVLPASRIV
jgi:phage tail-like protein